MARARAAAAPTAVTVKYDLFDLPTAQHKAGLAGLLLQIDHMNGPGKSPKPKAIPKVVARTPTTATIEFAAESVQCLFDDVYAATREIVKVKSKWATAKEAKPPEEVEEEIEEKAADGTVKVKKVKVKYFFYEQVQPTGNVLRQYVTNAPEPWLKLWRDMLWNIPRGNPTTRKPFEELAAKKSCGEGAAAWGDLVKHHQALANNAFHTDEVAGSLWLGAQAVNAEGVPFEGRVEQTLLLHFWPLTAQVYAPQILQPDGENEFVGYVLAIPEVADLKDFTAQYPRMLGQLGKDVRGYRPAEAVIDLPAEGALSFLEHLAEVSGEITEGKELASSLGSVEFIHLDKRGNNVKTLAAGRVAPRPGLLTAYLGIVGRVGEKPPYANPLFRRGLLLALLNDQPWFQPFGKLFADWDVSFFVPTDAPPAKLSWFWADARKKLQEVIQAMPTDPRPDDPPSEDDILATTIKRFVGRYLDARLMKDGGFDFDKYRAEKKTPTEAADARRKLAERLFLEFRSRRDQAFVDHFSGTFFAVGQYMGGKPFPRLFERVATALMMRTEDVKTLTLMALSANSWTPSKKKETPK